MIAEMTATERIADLEKTIQRLHKQNERLAAERLTAELQASIEVAKLKEKTSVLIADLLKRVGALEEQSNRIANFVQSHPTRDEFEQLQRQVSDLSHNTPV